MKTTSKQFITFTAAIMLFSITAAGAFAAPAPPAAPDPDCITRSKANKCQISLPTYAKVCNCSGADFSNQVFDSIDFSSVNFTTTSTKFNGASFKKATFNNADFTNASLAGADLTGSNIGTAKISGATFTCAKWVSGNWCDKKSIKGQCNEVATKPNGCP